MKRDKTTKFPKYSARFWNHRYKLNMEEHLNKNANSTAYTVWTSPHKNKPQALLLPPTIGFCRSRATAQLSLPVYHSPNSYNHFAIVEDNPPKSFHWEADSAFHFNGRAWPEWFDMPFSTTKYSLRSVLYFWEIWNAKDWTGLLCLFLTNQNRNWCSAAIYSICLCTVF